MTGHAGEQVFEPGDRVHVGDESRVSEVVRPSHRRPDCEPVDAPNIDICCVPVVLVRTPAGSGVLRWIRLSDLTLVVDAPEGGGDGSNASD